MREEKDILLKQIKKQYEEVKQQNAQFEEMMENEK